MADNEEGEIAVSSSNGKHFREFTGEGDYTLEVFKGNNSILFQLENIPEAKQGPKVLTRCSPAVQASVYHNLGIRNGVVPAGGVTLAAVYEALEQVNFETCTTDKQFIARMSKKRADHFKSPHKHLQLLKWLEVQRALLRDQSTLSDAAFQAIFERGSHPKFAVLVSTDGGKPYTTQQAWRTGVIAQDLQYDQTEAVSDKSTAAGNGSGRFKGHNRFNGNGNGNGNGGGNGSYKKGKFAAKGGVSKKADHSKYICRICNKPGHGPWDKDAEGNWVCPKKSSKT